MPVGLSAEGGEIASWSWLSPDQGWGSLTMTSTGKFVHLAHHFILLRLNPFGLSVDSEGWWFEHSMPQFWVGLSAEGAKNIFWAWLSPLRVWSSVTMTSTVKFVYMGHHFILLRLNPFGVWVDSGEWLFEHSML